MWLNENISYYLLAGGFVHQSDLASIARLNWSSNTVADRLIWSNVVIDLNDHSDRPEQRLEALLRGQPHTRGGSGETERRAERILTSLTLSETTEDVTSARTARRLRTVKEIMQISRGLKSLDLEIYTEHDTNLILGDGNGFHFGLRTLRLGVWWGRSIRRFLESQPSITSLDMETLILPWEMGTFIPATTTTTTRPIDGKFSNTVTQELLPALTHIRAPAILFGTLVHGQQTLTSLSISLFNGWLMRRDTTVQDLVTWIMPSLRAPNNVYELEASFENGGESYKYLSSGSLPHLRLLSNVRPRGPQITSIPPLPDGLDRLEGFRITLCRHCGHIPRMKDIQRLSRKCRVLKHIVVSVLDRPGPCRESPSPTSKGPWDDGHFLWLRSSVVGGKWSFGGLFYTFDYAPGRGVEDFASCCKNVKDVGTEKDPRWLKGWKP